MEVCHFSKPRKFGQGGKGIIVDDFGNEYEVQVEDHDMNFQPAATDGTIDLIFDYDPTTLQAQFQQILFPVGMLFHLLLFVLTQSQVKKMCLM